MEFGRKINLNQEQELRLVRLQTVAFYSREIFMTMCLPQEEIIQRAPNVKVFAGSILEEVNNMIYQEQFKLMTSQALSVQLPSTEETEQGTHIVVDYSPVATKSEESPQSRQSKVEVNHNISSPMTNSHYMTSSPPPPIRVDINVHQHQQNFGNMMTQPQQIISTTPTPTTVIKTESDINIDELNKLVSRKRRSRKGNKAAVKGQENRMCEWCGSNDTPEWRKGPNQELLCNACGLQYKKFVKEQKQDNSPS